MHTLTRTAMVVALVLPVFSGLIQAQQQMRIPDEIRYMQVEKNVVEREVTRPPLKARSSSAPEVTAGQVWIGKMWNGYTSLNRNSNQISYDPASNTLATIYRRGYPDRQNVRSGELTVNISTDNGNTWNGESPTINVGTENINNQLAARHPSIVLLNPTESPDRNDVTLAAAWAQLKPSGSFGEVPYASGPLNGPFTKNKWGPTPPEYASPVTPVVDLTTGKMFSLVLGIDPSTGNDFGEHYMVISTDKGVTWNINLNNPVLTEPVAGNLEIYTPTIDISPDGKTLVIAFIALKTDQGRFFINDVLHRIGFIKSTDGGSTWSQPETIPITALSLVNVELNKSIANFFPSLAVAVDAKGKEHFLVSLSSDTFYPLDSTYVGEITKGTSDWEFFGLDYINNAWVRRFLSPGVPPNPQTTFLLYNEHEFAKSIDGNKLYAKWVDPDSNFVTAPRGHPSPVARDTIHNIYMSAKDIRSNTEATRGWIFPAIKVTDTKTVDEKLTKMAPWVGGDGKLHIIFTVFGEGDAGPDTDDLAEANIYFVSGVSINVAVSTGKENLPSEFTLDQNYPNPFNPGTQINFSLSSSANARLRVFNLLGQEVATLVDRFMEAGQHTVNFNGAHLPSGIYTYRLESGGNVATQKMLLLK